MVLLEHTFYRVQTGVHEKPPEKVHMCCCSFLAQPWPQAFGLISTHPSNLSLDFRSFEKSGLDCLHKVWIGLLHS